MTLPIKKCFKCDESKPLSEYYAHPRMRDGHLNKCKDCTRQDVDRRYRALTATPEGLEAERARGRNKHKRLYSKGRNWKSPEGTAKEKKAANTKLTNAVRDGRIIKSSICEDCGDRPKRIHGHHEDYSKPLAVHWLCATCHRRRHAIHPDRIKPSRGPLYGK